MKVFAAIVVALAITLYAQESKASYDAPKHEWSI